MNSNRAIRVGAAAVLCLLACTACVQEAPGLGGLVITNSTTGPVKVVVMSQTPRATLDPIEAGRTKLSGIPYQDGCQSTTQYAVFDAANRMIARLDGTCSVKSPWVVSAPTVIVRNLTSQTVRVGSTTAGAESARTVAANSDARLSIDPDGEGCDTKHELTAWSASGQPLATLARACVYETWDVR